MGQTISEQPISEHPTKEQPTKVRILDILKLTPEMVKKSNFNLSSKTFNYLSAVYTPIVFYVASMHLIREKEKQNESIKTLADNVYNNPEYYMYDCAYARILSRLTAVYGEVRSKATNNNSFNENSPYLEVQKRTLLKEGMKEQYCIYHDTITAFLEGNSEECLSYVLTDPARSQYQKVLELLKMRQEAIVCRENLDVLKAENGRLKKEVDMLNSVSDTLDTLLKPSNAGQEQEKKEVLHTLTDLTSAKSEVLEESVSKVTTEKQSLFSKLLTKFKPNK